MDSDDSIVVALAVHLALLSMMAIGGGVVMLAPDIYRYVVTSNHWITREQFAAAYTIAQAAPGPNMLYVTLVGWWVAGWAGALAATLAITVPPLTCTLLLLRASRRHQAGHLGAAIAGGLAPVSVGLLAAGGWVLLRASDSSWRAVIVAALAVVLVMRTRLNPVWLIAAGGLIGMLHLV